MSVDNIVTISFILKSVNDRKEFYNVITKGKCENHKKTILSFAIGSCDLIFWPIQYP